MKPRVAFFDFSSCEGCQLNVINLKENLGYAGNNNVGIQLAFKRGADWVFVLNEDVILASDTLSKLV